MLKALNHNDCPRRKKVSELPRHALTFFLPEEKTSRTQWAVMKKSRVFHHRSLKVRRALERRTNMLCFHKQMEDGPVVFFSIHPQAFSGSRLNGDCLAHDPGAPRSPRRRRHPEPSFLDLAPSSVDEPVLSSPRRRRLPEPSIN
jgi:hypothetical protein